MAKTKQKMNPMLILIVVVALFFVLRQGGGGLLQASSPDLMVDRSWSGGVGQNHVLPGETIVATYHPATMRYYGIVEEVPAGWTSSKALSPDGKVRTAADGDDITITWTAPASVGDYQFKGQYFVEPDQVWTDFSVDLIRVCQSQASFECDGGDVYYFTSCNDKQSLKESCTAPSCDPMSVPFCGSGAESETVKESQTCYTATCAVDTCDTTSSATESVKTDAPNSNSGVCLWQCSGGDCQQNTPGDTNYDGCVADTEFPTAVTNWKNQQGGVSDINFPSIVSNWKNMNNCQP